VTLSLWPLCGAVGLQLCMLFVAVSQTPTHASHPTTLHCVTHPHADVSLKHQGVTVTPFRVVDEINQGMDPTNERRVFEQLVTASCQAGTPQCFLLTPKLLPDLPFTEVCVCVCVWGGG
jgi:hypothetical protein